MTDQTLTTARNDFQKALVRMKEEFSKLQVGRANAGLVEGIMVDMYGTSQPLKAVANVSVPDSKTLSIQPWDRSALGAIEKAVVTANLGLNPSNNGLAVIISIPPLTEERRAEVAKKVRGLAEDAKISVRNARQDALNALKKMKDDKTIAEDDYFSAEKKLQEAVDEINKQIDEVAGEKEKGVMTV
jgi:ribosome recycling factor